MYTRSPSIHSSVVVAVAALVALMAVGCSKDAGVAQAANVEDHGLKAEVSVPVGVALASCIEQKALYIYAVKRQEFGAPWKDKDTFAFYDAREDRIQISFFGSAGSVDGAKERVTARKPAISTAIRLCEAELNVPIGLVEKGLFMTYAKLDRKNGTLQDIIQFGGNRFDFPTDIGPMSATAWGPMQGLSDLAEDMTAKTAPASDK